MTRSPGEHAESDSVTVAAAKQRALIFIVAYNAEPFIESVLDRIPASIWNSETCDSHVLVIDDSSTDRTYLKVEEYRKRHRRSNMTLLYNPRNQGYGGNQKIGFHYAVANDFDLVILLHGDGQYAPELLADLIAPLCAADADVVLGSRMLKKYDALKGGMPFYKWVGNLALTKLQNLILGSRLAEFHTGYRAYRVAALKSIPFQRNSDYFDFDTEILIQMIQTGKKLREVPIPTFYGSEECRVNGVRYAFLVLLACIRSRVQRLGIWYDPKFNYDASADSYTSKFGFVSSHQFALDRCCAGSTVLDLGCGGGFMAQALQGRAVRVVSVDRVIQPLTEKCSARSIQADLDEFEFDINERDIKTVLALDVINHLKSPEKFLAGIRQAYGNTSPETIISTANVGFVLVRLALLFGSFNYGKRGILDLDHKRLFTFASLRRILNTGGFEIEAAVGLPAPFPLAFGHGFLSRLLLFLNRALIAVSKSLFAYQIVFVVRPRPTLEHLLSDARKCQT